jgi:small subunit ribosomal protein S8
MTTDPIADMLTRIRNAVDVRHERVEMPASKPKAAIAAVLRQEGYIRDFETVEDGRGHQTLRIHLKYSKDRARERAIIGIRRISRPGLRVYAKREGVPRVLGGLGVAVVSTSQGILSDREARRRGLGGEVLLYVW